MHKKTILVTLLIAIFTTAVLTTRPTSAVQLTQISITPKTISGTAAEVGKNFTITVRVAEVTKLWGYQFLLVYNTTILTATSYVNRANETYSEFNVPQPSELNDNPTWDATFLQNWIDINDAPPPYGNQTGYVAVAYSCPYGDAVGLTTGADPKPLTNITFTVDALGTTTLDLLDNRVIGGAIGPPAYSVRVDHGTLTVADAFFSNTQVIQLHDVAVTTVTTSTSTATPGDTIGVDVKVSNLGAFTENVTVFIKYNDTASTTKAIGTPKAILNLAPGTNQTEPFTWNTANIPTGTYVIRAEASITQDDDQTNNIRNSGAITLSTTGGGIPTYIIYIAVGVVLVAVLAVGFYLRGRGKKP